MRVQREVIYVRVDAPAKLNLFFEVLGKRIDGFHEIETLMVPINLYDSLMFTPHFSGATPPGAFWPPPAPHARLPVVEEIALDCRWAGSDNLTTSLGTLPPA